MANNRSPLAVQEMQILHHLKKYGESHIHDLFAQFEEFETRHQLSLCLGNMRQAGLIAKNNPGRWSLTSVGRGMLKISGHPNDGLQSVKAEPEDQKPTDVLQLLEKLQEQVPAYVSLVIERDALFFVVARQKFEIQCPGDFEAMSLVADRYAGQVA